MSHMLDCQLFGLNPLGHHLVSVADSYSQHSDTVFRMLRNMTGAIWPSAFVAGGFRVTSDSGGIGGVGSRAKNGAKRAILDANHNHVYLVYKTAAIGRYILLLLVFCLCIMTKPIVVTLPLALLLLDYWPLDRVRWGHRAKVAATADNKSKIRWMADNREGPLAGAVGICWP